MIRIDIPQVAYKTWQLEYRIYDKDGNRCRDEEYKAERSLKEALRNCEYSAEHDHVR